MKTLYLFVNSERSDQYLNSIVYCVLKRDVRRLAFIHIQGMPSNEEQGEGLSGRALGAVQAQLEGLAERGEYLGYPAKDRARKSLTDLYDAIRARQSQALYKQCRDTAVTFSNEELPYSDLHRRLREIARTGSDSYIDVTAIKKRYLGDLVAAAVVEGIEGLYTFELVAIRPDFDRPWTMLVHELWDQSPQAFTYTNLLDTPVYKTCVKLVARRAPTLKAFAVVTVLMLASAAAGYWYLGSKSAVIQTTLAMGGIASLLTLGFLFVPQRRNP